MRPIHIITAAATLVVFALSAADGNASCLARKEVHGIWKGNDNSTYYITRRGNDIWWLGQSNDQKSWANVFKGTLNGNVIQGQFADVFGNVDGNGGALRLQIVRSQQGGINHIDIQSASGGFGTKRWSYSC